MVWSQLGEATGNALDFAPSSSGFNFMDYVNKGLDFGKSAFGGVTDFLNTNSKGLGALGGLTGAYMQYDMGNKMYDMQKQAFNYNKMLSDREKKRQEEAEKAMQYGFSNSGLGA